MPRSYRTSSESLFMRCTTLTSAPKVPNTTASAKLRPSSLKVSTPGDTSVAEQASRVRGKHLDPGQDVAADRDPGQVVDEVEVGLPGSLGDGLALGAGGAGGRRRARHIAAEVAQRVVVLDGPVSGLEGVA